MQIIYVVGIVLAFWSTVFAGEHAGTTDPARHQTADEARMVEALARYRAIERLGGWPIVPEGPVLEPEADDPRVMILRRRLAATGDLSGSEDGPNYDADVVRAVQRFQARHGLVVDGRVGPATLAALNVPVARRIAQLEINLDRRRNAPELASTHIRINTAAAVLEVMERDTPIMRMSVVVGDRRHPTPVFHSQVTAVIFNPPWNIPTSIAAREILPQLRRDPNYLAAHDIRIIGRSEDPFGRMINWREVAAARFPFRFRQEPGPRNALGLLKFEVPNPFRISLHDTPAKALFDRPVRAFSHGCVRLARPRELAALLLPGQKWSASRIDAAIAAGVTRRVAIEPPVPVHVLYLTAFVDPDGTVHFRDDIYGRDAAAFAVRSNARPERQHPDSISPIVADRAGCGMSD